MQILITGATGFIGSALTARLQREGHQVTAWVRDVGRAEAVLGPAVRLVHTADDEALEWAVAQADAVINLAGAPILDSRWTTRRRQVLLDSRVGVTKKIVDAIAAAPTRPSVLVSGSAIGYYGAGGDDLIHEATAAGRGFAAQLCASWEQEARRAKQLGVRVVRARIGIVLGDGGMLGKVLPMFRAGLGGNLGSGRQYLPWIHIDDAVSALLHAVQDERCSGAMNIVGPDPVRYRTFVRELGRIVGRSAWLPAPAFALRAVLGRRAGMMLASQRVVPRALERVGFSFRFNSLASALENVCGVGEANAIPTSTPTPNALRFTSGAST